MFALALPILGRLLPIVGIALAAWFAWGKVDNWCNGACQSARSETEQVSSELLQLKQVVQQAQERATALALTAFGTGIGLILAAGGGAMWARKDREAE